jgi:hypothetical protein
MFFQFLYNYFAMLQTMLHENISLLTCVRSLPFGRSPVIRESSKPSATFPSRYCSRMQGHQRKFGKELGETVQFVTSSPKYAGLFLMALQATLSTSGPAVSQRAMEPWTLQWKESGVKVTALVGELELVKTRAYIQGRGHATNTCIKMLECYYFLELAHAFQVFAACLLV